ncbi:MAG: hypothetical protein GXP55_04755 [Deltaproteobacteria bacterium]|nr:hypothetical protein [Deltaproteobacteria bacterium]
MALPEDALVEQLTAIRAGDLRDLEVAQRQLAALDDVSARAAKLAFDCALSLVDRTAPPPPSPEELRPFVGASAGARRWARAASGDLERVALIRFDRQALACCRGLHAQLLGDDTEASLGLRRADAWLLLMDGSVEDLDELGKQLFSAASAARDASVVIDATSLRALAALANDQLEEATALARRASRMARTEGLRPERYLASILLARVRRRAGRPHLSTRILSAIAPIAPRPWQGWIAWERVLSGSRPESLLQGLAEPSERAAEALVGILDRAAAGDLEGFDAAGARLAEVAVGFAPMAREGRVLISTLDPRLCAEDCPDVAVSWCRGDASDTPLGLGGLVGPPDGPADSTIASVVSRPGVAPRRILRIGLPLLECEGKVLRLSRTRLRRGRVDTAVAALALAGAEGLPDEELFLRAYEFPFQPSIHAGILDVLVHRMRARLEGAATVHREASVLRLEPHGLLALSDPRCVEHVEDRLVRLIATLGGVTTRRAARELDVSVRTAQLALRRLLESGDCVQSRDGRRVHYTVEDTTFTEPTRF